MTDQDIIDQATRIMASTPPADLIQALAGAGLLNPWSSVEEEQVRAEKAEAERDALAATVQRVRWLGDEWDMWGHDGVPIRPDRAAAHLRRALDDPQEQP